MDTPALVVLSILGGLAVGGVLYALARKLKGRVEITLSKQVFNLGEEIQGTARVHARGSVLVKRALLGLECREIHQGKKGSNSSRAFYHEIVLREQFALQGGAPVSLPFAISLPRQLPDRLEAFEADMQKVSPGLAQAVRILGALGGRGRLEWSLSVEIEVDGVDFGARRRLNVHSHQ